MTQMDLIRLQEQHGVRGWRLRLATWVESPGIQRVIIAAILLNAAVLGLETSPGIKAEYGGLLQFLDKFCLILFIVELVIKITAFRLLFWKSGWNWFDFIIVAIALVPNAGPWSVLRSLRILRVLRLLTVVPQLRKVVAAFLHAIPGLSGVIHGVFIWPGAW